MIQYLNFANITHLPARVAMEHVFGTNPIISLYI